MTKIFFDFFFTKMAISFLITLTLPIGRVKQKVQQYKIQNFKYAHNMCNSVPKGFIYFTTLSKLIMRIGIIEFVVKKWKVIHYCMHWYTFKVTNSIIVNRNYFGQENKQIFFDKKFSFVSNFLNYCKLAK